jgi:uncharacterized protein (TIGR03437 family)
MKTVLLRLAAAGILCSLATPLLHGQPDRIVNPIDSSRVVVLPGGVNPRAQAADDKGAVDPSMEIPSATLYLRPSADQQTALEQLLADQQDPDSPNFHRWLTPEEYADRFGLSRGDIAKLAAWLASEGLTVNSVARGRRWIVFSGSAATVGSAFHTAFHRYATDGENHFANVTPPSIPQALADAVAAIGGLDNYELTPAYGKHRNVGGPDFTCAPTTQGLPCSLNVGTHFLTPADIKTIYDLNPLKFDGTGQTIAIIGDSDLNLQDIQTFRAEFGLPPNDPQLMRTGPDPMSTANLLEADIDIEWSGAVAPGATIIYVYAISVMTAVQYAVDQRVAPIISMGFGECEPRHSVLYQPIAQQANAEGITWVASSGDSGAAGCDVQQALPQATKGLAVQMPASVPEVTAVGGTEFNDASGAYWNATNNSQDGSALSYIPEEGWNDTFTLGYLASSTGGASIFFPKPAWQTGPGVPSDGARDVPDIALSASWNHDGYWLYSDGQLMIVGGTSVTAPQFAGFLALLNEYLISKGATSSPGLGNINPVLYHLAQTAPSAFHDITTSNNVVPCMQGTPNCATGSFGYNAAVGYDLVTGLGSPDFYNLAVNWTNGSATTTTVTASPAAIPFYGGSTQLTATVTTASGTPTGTVAFIYDDATLGEATLSGAGFSATATLTVDSLQLGLGSNAITAVYSGSNSFNGSSGSTTAVTNASGRSAVQPSVTPNPVYQQPPDLSGNTWFYSIALTNLSNVPSTLTKFTIDGNDQTNPFPTVAIPANGQLVALGLPLKNLSPPVNMVFEFDGIDPGGLTWSQQLTVQFVSRVLVEPSLLLTTPATVWSASPANASCQWQQPLELEERGGFDTRLSKLLLNDSSDISAQLQQIFGATTIAPFGMLQGTLCLNSSTPVGTESLSLSGATTETAAAVSINASTLLEASPSALITTSVSPPSVNFSAGGDASVSLTFNGGEPAWTAKVSPANQTTSWLTLSPLSGTGSATLTLAASANGLANGVYNATVLIQCDNATPQFTMIPVVLLVGRSPAVTIGGVSNAASGQTVLAPGALMSVYGLSLSPATEHAGRIPLPLTMQGVSATVNGFSAPLLDVLPEQLNVQVPYETGAGTAILGVNNNGKVAYFPFQVAAAAPGIFMTEDGKKNLVPNSTTNVGDPLSAYITGEGDIAPPVITGTAPTIATPVTGLPAPALPVSVTVGGVPATIQFIGIPYLVGVTQINFSVPAGVPPGPQPVVVTVGGVSSPPVMIEITQPSSSD